MADRSATVKTVAVVASAAGLAALMLLYEPDASEHMIAPEPHVIVVAPPIVQPEALEPISAPAKLASLSSARPQAPDARTQENLEWPHVYCAPDRIGEIVHDWLSTLDVPCLATSPIAGRQYHSDMTGEFLIEHSPLLRASSIRRFATLAASDNPLGCLKRIEFTPPALLFPPYNRPFTHITVASDGVDYGKVLYEKLPNGNWLVHIPSRCDAADPGKEMTVVISFWPNYPTDVGSPLQIAIAKRSIVVK